MSFADLSVKDKIHLVSINDFSKSFDRLGRTSSLKLLIGNRTTPIFKNKDKSRGLSKKAEELYIALFDFMTPSDKRNVENIQSGGKLFQTEEEQSQMADEDEDSKKQEQEDKPRTEPEIEEQEVLLALPTLPQPVDPDKEQEEIDAAEEKVRELLKDVPGPPLRPTPDTEDEADTPQVPPDLGTVVGTVIDEPRPPQVEEQQETGTPNVVDEVSDVDKIEDVFNKLKSVPGLPDNIKFDIRAAGQSIKRQKNSGKSKSEIFETIKNVTKKVLEFIALAPLPIPEEIKLGAAGLLVGIKGAEQVSDIIKGETSETGAISKAIELATGIKEMAPVIEVASGIVQVVDATLKIRDTLVEEQKNKDALDSVPIPTRLLDGNLRTTKAIEETVINHGVIDSDNITVKIQVPTDVDQINVPINIGPEDSINPDIANEILTSKGKGDVLPPGVAEQTSTSTTQEKKQKDIIQITQGDPGIDTRTPKYKKANHPDALGIYFGSSTRPKWNSDLLNDRKERFSEIDPESTRSYLLQQTRMIWNQYSVDLLIPKLLFDEGSSIEDVIKENNEVLQLWSKLKGMSKEQDSDIVGISLGELLKFRGLLTSDTPNVADGTPNVADGTPTPTPTSETPTSDTPDTPTTVTPTQQTPSSKPEETRHPKDRTKKFNYSNVSGIRLWSVTDDAEIEENITPSLVEVVTANGAPPLSTRRNLTRGFQHGGPVARGNIMNGIRTSIVGTVANEPTGSGYSRTGQNLDQARSATRFNIRIRNLNNT